MTTGHDHVVDERRRERRGQLVVHQELAGTAVVHVALSEEAAGREQMVCSPVKRKPDGRPVRLCWHQDVSPTGPEIAFVDGSADEIPGRQRVWRKCHERTHGADVELIAVANGDAFGLKSIRESDYLREALFLSLCDALGDLFTWIGAISLEEG